MADMQAIAEEVFQQIQAAGAHALKDGVAIILPQYLDSEEIESLEMSLSSSLCKWLPLCNYIGNRPANRIAS
jgi:hypothetical protein